MQEEQLLLPIRVRVRQIIRETADTRSFILERVDLHPINYLPGQFLTLVFLKKDGAEARRSYSISSAPALGEPLMITVKRIANGEFSRKLVDDMQVGDELRSIGASGFFTLPPDMTHYRQLVFFAAGSGIAPVFSLIKTVLYTDVDIPVLLIYSNRSPETTIFYQALKQLQQLFPERLNVIYLFSTTADLSKARLNVDLLHGLLVKTSKDRHDRLFYLCGPFEYMRMITIALQGYGVPAGLIRKEIFHIEKPAKRPSPPDTLLHRVKILLGGKEYTFESQYPVTILQAAKALNIPLPYSCESGQCGTCAATCIAGKVWMWHNDVLLDEEINKGRVLTCTGYAVGGDVELEIGAIKDSPKA